MESSRPTAGATASLDEGVIAPPARLPLPERLRLIHDGLASLISPACARTRWPSRISSTPSTLAPPSCWATCAASSCWPAPRPASPSTPFRRPRSRPRSPAMGAPRSSQVALMVSRLLGLPADGEAGDADRRSRRRPLPGAPCRATPGAASRLRTRSRDDRAPRAAASSARAPRSSSSTSQGVGYRVSIPVSTFYRLGDEGASAASSSTPTCARMPSPSSASPPPRAGPLRAPHRVSGVGPKAGPQHPLGHRAARPRGGPARRRRGPAHPHPRSRQEDGRAPRPRAQGQDARSLSPRADSRTPRRGSLPRTTCSRRSPTSATRGPRPRRASTRPFARQADGRFEDLLRRASGYSPADERPA